MVATVALAAVTLLAAPGAAQATPTPTPTATSSAPAGVPTALGGTAAIPRDYLVVDLGTAAESKFAIATGINEQGQVAGHLVDAPASQLFSWDRWSGERRELGRIWTAAAMNEDGDVAVTVTSQPTAAYWDASAGALVALPSLVPGGRAGTLGINDAGVVVGGSVVVGGGEHAVRWDGGVPTDLTPDANVVTTATAINDHGDIVGWIDTHGVRWPAGSPTPVVLGTLGGERSSPWGLNEAGQVVGTSYTAGNLTQHGFVTMPGSDELVDVTPGATGSTALGINESGVVVGNFQLNTPAWYAYVRYPDGTLAELPGAVGQQDSVATAINDRGWIAGRIGNHAVVWIPLSYTDTSTAAPFADAIQWLADGGLAGGYGGAFRPTAPATRQAVAALLYRVAGRPNGAHPTCTTPPYPDVPVDHPFCGEIAWMATTAVERLRPGTPFRPTEAETRGEIANHLSRLSRLPEQVGYSCYRPAFPDVPAAHPACGGVSWMVDAEVTTGYADGGFHPDAPVSRQAVAVFLQRYAAR